MSAPNLANITTITAKSVLESIVTGGTTLLSNAADSGKLYKISSITVANIDGANNADITLRIAKNGGGSVTILNTISVPADSVLIAYDKNTPIYLEENDNITAVASANGDLSVLVNYEEIS